jgi:DNA-binding IclR family transcriptional regulator
MTLSRKNPQNSRIVASTRQRKTQAGAASSPPQTARSGTQSIERVVSLLRIVASKGRSGMRLAEVSAACGLPSSTCYRMLQRLEIEGLLERHALTRKYFLGALLFELGLLAKPQVQLAERCEHTLAALAEHTKDTLYLSERRGLEAVCSARALGDYPIKVLTLDVGVRRPLGIGAGGLAILCALPDKEADEIIAANAALYPSLSAMDAEQVRAAVQQGRKQGYSFLDGPVIPGVASVGVAFAVGHSIAAISVAAISSRLDPTRRAAVAAELHNQVRSLSGALDPEAANAFR